MTPAERIQQLRDHMSFIRNLAHDAPMSRLYESVKYLHSIEARASKALDDLNRLQREIPQ